MNDVALELLKRGYAARFLALRYDDHADDGSFWLVGGKQPSTFKLLRNARRAAGDDGIVLVFDLASLPMVAAEATHPGVDLGNEIDEESFAERQMLFWERELAAIRARKR